MDYSALATLIQTHPSWPSVTDDDLTTWVNEEAITATHETISTGTVFSCIAANVSEFNTLTASQQTLVWNLLFVHSGEGFPTASGAPARDLIVSIFSGKTGTLNALSAAISYLISRAANAGILGEVKVGDVVYARTLT